MFEFYLNPFQKKTIDDEIKELKNQIEEEMLEVMISNHVCSRAVAVFLTLSRLNVDKNTEVLIIPLVADL